MSEFDSVTPKKGRELMNSTIKHAYIWGDPMVVMRKSRDAMTKGGDASVTPDVFKKTGKFFASVNQVASTVPASSQL